MANFKIDELQETPVAGGICADCKHWKYFAPIQGVDIGHCMFTVKVVTTEDFKDMFLHGGNPEELRQTNFAPRGLTGHSFSCEQWEEATDRPKRHAW